MEDDFVDGKRKRGVLTGLPSSTPRDVAASLLGMLVSQPWSRLHDDLREIMCDIIRVDMMGGDANACVIERMSIVFADDVENAASKLMSIHFAGQCSAAELQKRSRIFGAVVRQTVRNHIAPALRREQANHAVRSVPCPGRPHGCP